MTDDLVQRLRELSMRKHDEHNLLAEAADRIEMLEKEQEILWRERNNALQVNTIDNARINALEAALREIRDLGQDEAQFTFRYIAQRALDDIK